MYQHGRRPLVLARYLALAWCGLIVYGSLHPFSGWQDMGVPLLAFLEADWPKYWTAFDLIANVAVYIPLGFFLALALSRLPWRFTALCLATLLAGSLSLGMETLQNWLPTRIPSNVDLACNTLGGLIGAIWAQLLGPRIFSRLESTLHRLLAPLPHGELGLTLLGLWMMVPLSPETLLFGAGDLRQLLSYTPPIPFSVDSYALIEAGITACNAVAVGLILRGLLVKRRFAYLIVPMFLLCGLAIRMLGAAILVSPAEAMAWLTPGAQQGLLAASAVLLLTLWLPARASLLLAGLALIAGTLLVNLAPANPYSAAALAAWRQGHFLNFNGLTRLVASLWPFLALPFLWLTLRAAQRRFT
jgi:VanZ family protein